MAISETARRNHEELFPGHTSTLAVTDPELIEVFDDFAFDEVLQHGNLDARNWLMVQLASMIACQALREYRVMLGAAMIVGVTPIEVKEIVYQAVPYVGMRRTKCLQSAASNYLFLVRQQPLLRRASKEVARFKPRSSVRIKSRSFTKPLPKTRCTSSGISRPIALATTSRAAALTSLHAAWSKE